MDKLEELFKDKKMGGEPPMAPTPEPAPVEGQQTETAAPTPPPPQEPAPVVAGEQKPAFDINSFNSFFNTSLKEESELKNVLQRANDYESVTKKYEETESARKALEEKAKALEAGQDVMKYFSSPDAYIAEQIRIKRSDLDPSVVTKLLNHDKTRLADFDLLAYDLLMQNPNIIGGLEGAKELVAKKYDVDPEETEDKWERASRNMMMTDARAVEQRVAQLKSEIKLPEIKSPEAIEAERTEAVQKMKAQWSPYVNDISSFDKLTVPGDNGAVMLEMEVPKAFRDTLPEYVNGIIEQTGLEPNPDNIKEVIDYRNRMFVYEYLPKILEVYGNNVRSEIEKKYAELLNNTTPPNTNVAPPPIDATPGGGVSQLLGSTKRSRINK